LVRHGRSCEAPVLTSRRLKKNSLQLLAAVWACRRVSPANYCALMGGAIIAAACPAFARGPALARGPAFPRVPPFPAAAAGTTARRPPPRGPAGPLACACTTSSSCAPGRCDPAGASQGRQRCPQWHVR
jgi:hypothetical protein